MIDSEKIKQNIEKDVQKFSQYCQEANEVECYIMLAGIIHKDGRPANALSFGGSAYDLGLSLFHMMIDHEVIAKGVKNAYEAHESYKAKDN